MNSVEMIGRLILALGAVLLIMWLLARFARRPLAGKSDRVVTVLARQQLNRNASVAVLKVLDRAFVVGVTDQGVNLLTETDLPALEEALASQGSKPGRGRLASAEPTAAAAAIELAPGHSGFADRPAVAIGPLAPLEPTVLTAAAMTAAPSAPAGGHRAAGSARGSRGGRAAKAPRPTRRSAATLDAEGKKSPLDGSILSPKTWSALINVARDVTVRR